MLYFAINNLSLPAAPSSAGLTYDTLPTPLLSVLHAKGSMVK